MSKAPRGPSVAQIVTAWERDRFALSLNRFGTIQAGDAALAIIVEGAAAARRELDRLVAQHILDRADGALGALGSVFA
jgi:predicted ArsR family transcriptional regulator